MASPELKLRRAVQADYVILAEFGRRAFLETFGPDNRPEDMEAYLAGAFSPELQAAEIAEMGSVFLIAEIDGVLAGYARLLEGHAPEGLQAEHPVELVRIYADQPWIGHGVGSALMQGCLDEADRMGCDWIWLGVWERNERAIGFYHKWGFSRLGTHIFKLGSDLQTDLILARRILV